MTGEGPLRKGPWEGMAGIFPLPPVAAARGRRRRGRARAEALMESEAVSALNWLSRSEGREDLPPPKPHLQNRVMADLRSLVRRAWPEDADFKPPCADEALRELLRGRSTYDVEDGSSSTMVPFNARLLSLPAKSEVAQSPEVQAVAPADVLFWMEGSQERMLRDPADRLRLERERGITVYSDPSLMGNRRNYERFVQKLQSLGLVRFLTHRRCDVGLFCVRKKDGLQRLIMDCRRSNLHFKNPPGVSMCTSESLARIEVMLPDSVEPNSPEYVERLAEIQASIGIADVSNCFHRLRVPLSMSRYFAMPPVRAKAVGLAGSWVDGQSLEPDDLIYPASAVLPMGLAGH